MPFDNPTLINGRWQENEERGASHNPSYCVDSEHRARPSTPQLLRFERGQHEGFPDWEVLLWAASARDFSHARGLSAEDLPTLAVPREESVAEHLDSLGGYRRLEAGTLVATCLAQDIEKPTLHQVVFALLPSDGASSMPACWADVRQQVLGQAKTDQSHLLVAAQPAVMELGVIPGMVERRAAKRGLFVTGVLVRDRQITLAVNSAVSEKHDVGQQPALRTKQLAHLTQRLAQPLHEVHTAMHSSSHCALLAASARAASEPRLTLGNEQSWTATQLEWSVAAPLPSRARRVEHFSAWGKGTHDDTFLPSVSVNLPALDQDTTLVHEAAIVSSIGFYFALPHRPATFVVARHFATLFMPPRAMPSQQGSSVLDDTLTLTASADVRIVSQSCLSLARTLPCPQVAAAYGDSVDVFERQLGDALGSHAKAAAWLGAHGLHHGLAWRKMWLGSSTAFEEAWSAQGPAELLQSTTGLAVAHSAFKDCAVDQASLDGAAAVHSNVCVSMTVVEAFACIANVLAGQQPDESCDQSCDEESESRAEGAVRASSGTSTPADPVAEQVQSSGTMQLKRVQEENLDETDPRVGGLPSQRLGRKGRVAQKRKLGLTPDQILLLSDDGLDADRAAVFREPGWHSGPVAVREVIDARVLRLRGLTRNARGPATIQVMLAADSITSLSRWQQEQEELVTLFHNANSRATSLRFRIQALVAAHRFYQSLERYSLRLSEQAHKGADVLVREYGIEVAVAELVVELHNRFVVKPRSRTSEANASHGQLARKGLQKTQRRAWAEPLPWRFVKELVSSRFNCRAVDTEGSSDIWLRSIPQRGKAGRRSNAEAVQVPLFDVLLQTVGSHFSCLLGSQSGDNTDEVLDARAWPMTARRVSLRMEMLDMLCAAHNGSYRSLALPGICTLVLKPFWFFDVDYKGQFWDPSKCYIMPQSWRDFVSKAACWTAECESLEELFHLTQSYIV